jgi:hypothetical protein
VITLKGGVNSWTAKRMAARAAERVERVHKIADEMKVDLPLTMFATTRTSLQRRSQYWNGMFGYLLTSLTSKLRTAGSLSPGKWISSSSKSRLRDKRKPITRTQVHSAQMRNHGTCEDRIES